MAAQKNRHNQDVTDTGHVIKESEKIAVALKQLEFPHNGFQINYWDDDELKVLVDFIMHYGNDKDFYYINMGRELERKTVVRSLKSGESR